jgi:murein DD-endopeptidase MepM/ murein hydrolase activator NlpD
VQPGDTLGAIAAASGVSTDSLARLNNLTNPDLLSVGQVLQLPNAPTSTTPDHKLISDTRFVRSASGAAFDVEAFVSQQPGYISTATDEVSHSLADGRRIDVTLTAAEIVNRVALEFSVDPRLLLALLEYRSGWLSNSQIPDDVIRFPMGEVDESREGLYRQLAWTADQLNAGYYGWKYRGWQILPIDEGGRLSYAGELNAGTVGIQYFLSLNNTLPVWLQQVSPGGFDTFYHSLFGDPFVEETETLVPVDLNQPDLTLPFSPDEVWFYTGGPHGGWGSGSAWSAVDFAPPDERTAGMPACYVSEFPVRAVAQGTITRSEGGVVWLDLDGDGNEATGWTILYLHIASQGRVMAGTQVQTGDIIGYAACEGGFSTATHLHIARRYNGEWIPAYCHQCEPPDQTPPFVMSDWTVIGFENQEYQGVIVKGNERRQAEQGRQNPINRVSW